MARVNLTVTIDADHRAQLAAISAAERTPLSHVTDRAVAFWLAHRTDHGMPALTGTEAANA